MQQKITPSLLLEKKKEGQKITMLTAYDALFASLLDGEVDIILVGDSVGNVLLGYEDTLNVSMQDILHHTRAVKRKVSKSMVVADMPFMSYQISIEEALKNASLLIKEADADAVKLEVSKDNLDVVEALIKSGIPVMGHIGLLPQTFLLAGSFSVKGKSYQEGVNLCEVARALQDLGCFSIVLECIPYKLAHLISENLKIPTIGIGSGPGCDGQVLVLYDLLGFFEDTPRFVRKYRNWKEDFKQVIKEFKEDVISGRFPSLKESYNMNEDIFQKIKRHVFGGFNSTSS